MAPDPRPPLATYEDLAARTDYSLVKPELNATSVLAGLRSARQAGVASVVVRPCDLDLAVRTLDGSSVKPSSVAGYPYGFQTTAVKLYELRDLLRRGAREVGIVIALPNLLSREFQHVQTELVQATESCRREQALLHVIIPGGYLPDDLKIIACGCCDRAEVDFVQASTPGDAELLRRHLPEEIEVKAAGWLTTLQQVLEAYAAGYARMEPDTPAAILEEWKSTLPKAGS